MYIRETIIKHIVNKTHSYVSHFIPVKRRVLSAFSVSTMLTTIAVITILLSLLNFTKNSAYAHTISPSVEELELQAREKKSKKILFTNTKNKPITIKVETTLYNPQTSKIITPTTSTDITTETSETDSPKTNTTANSNNILFISTTQSIYIIQPKETKTIPYIVTVPPQTPIGTYFNLITFTEQKDEGNKDQMTVLYGLGTLVRIDVVTREPLENADTAVIKHSNLDIDIIKQGGLLRPTKFTVSFKNNSDFVLTPHGIILIVNNSKNDEPIRLALHVNEKRVYPGQRLTKTYSAQIWKFQNWKTFVELFRQKTIVAKIKNNRGDVLTKSANIHTLDGYFLVIIPIVSLVTLTVLVNKLLLPYIQKRRILKG